MDSHIDTSINNREPRTPTNAPRILPDATVSDIEKWLDTHVMPYRGMVEIRKNNGLHPTLQRGQAPFEPSDIGLRMRYIDAIESAIRKHAPAVIWAMWNRDY